MTVLSMLAFSPSFGQELFPDTNAREYRPFERLEPESTIGGRPIFSGGRNWLIAQLEAAPNNMGTKIAGVSLVSPHRGDYFLEMSTVASISSSQEAGYFAADLCSPSVKAIIKVSKPSGRNDNCLLVAHDIANLGNRTIPGLMITVRNSKSNWRLYQVRLFANLEVLGFPNATAEDWSATAIEGDPGKKQLIDNLKPWAESLQAAVDKAIDYSKPANAFASLAPIDSILPAVQMPAQSSNFASNKSASPSTNYVYCSTLERMVNEQESCPVQ